MRKKSLYFECYSGISGDMTVAALLDLGANEEVLKKALYSLPVSGFEIKITRVAKSGIDACDFNVILDHDHENHDHDMAYLHGHSNHHHDDEHDHEHHHHHDEHEHKHHHHHDEHEHEHHHHHGEHGHIHEHRNLADILHIIDHADITDHAKAAAKQIFQILAEAEANAHGRSLDEVHFHEVGAVDSIVDIVAVAVCLDNLGIDDIIVSELYEGRGFVRCQHGMIPIPVPAVSNIAAAHSLSLHLTQTEGELVTPTGAAIVAAVKTSDTLPDKYTITRIGIGAGKREYERPSMLRAMIIESDTQKADSDTTPASIIKLETNIDDCGGEALAYTMNQLFENGALDVFYTPVYMKKNRPGILLSILCTPDIRQTMEAIIFCNTTSIGIRYQNFERTKLDRTIKTLRTPLGDANVKICTYHDQTYIYPENDSVAALASLHHMSFLDVYDMIKHFASEV